MSQLKNRLKELDALLGKGNLLAAEKILAEILEDYPQHEGVRVKQITVAAMQDDFKRVEQLAMQLLQDKPKHKEATFFLAQSCERQEKWQDAGRLYKSLIRHKFAGSILKVRYGRVCFKLGDMASAETAFKAVAAMEPRNVDAMEYVATACNYQGKMDEARTWAKKALALCVARPTLIRMLIIDLKCYDVISVGAIEKILLQQPWKASERSSLLLAQYHLEKIRGAYGASARSLIMANQVIEREYSTDISEVTHMVNAVEASFSVEWLEKMRLKEPEPLGFTPIFIVGMPRSGTSMIQQLLSAHPEVYGAGECQYVGNIVGEWGKQKGRRYPDLVSTLAPEQMVEMRQHYKDSMAHRLAGHRYIVDKMPANIHFLGLIHAVFPEAKIIVTNRDAMSCCFSIYGISFRTKMPYAYDQKKLAIWFNEIKRLGEFWGKIIPQSSMQHVSYDDLVASPNNNAPKLFSFCGLQWREEYLEFYKQKNTVQTASAAQVRQPIHNRANEQWKPYASYLAEMQEALACRA